MAVPVNEGQSESDLTSNGTSLAVTLPASVAADDIILFLIALDGVVSNIGGSGGMTINEIAVGVVGSNNTYAAAWARASGGETTQTITWTGSQQGRIMAIRVSGVDSTIDPIDQISGVSSSSASSDQIVQSITPSVDDTLCIAGVSVDRDRVDGSDGLDTANGFTETGISASSGGANGAGLIVADKGITTATNSLLPTFGNWATDSSVSIMFNIKSIEGGTAVERTASQTITESDVVNRGASTFQRTGATVLVHSEAIDRGGSTFERIGTTVFVHSSVINTVLGKVRTAVQTIIHSSVVDRGGSTFERVGTTILVHSETITRILENIRTAVQAITHSEAISRQLDKLRTAITILVHSESVARLLAQLRSVAQNITHSSIILREGSIFQRIASTILTHIDSVVVVKTVAPVDIPTPEFGSVRTPRKRITALMSDGFNEVRIITHMREVTRENLVRVLNTIYYPYGEGTPVTIIRSIKKTFGNNVRIINPVQKSHSSYVAINLRPIFNGGENKAKLSVPIFNFGSQDILIKKKVFDKGMKNVRIIRSTTVEGSNIVKVKSLPEIIDEIEDNAR